MNFFNIALIPVHHVAQFIQYAESLSSIASADTYHIGRGASIPHVSLSHFAWNPSKIEVVWESVQALKAPILSLNFDHHRSKTYGDDWWVSLIPDHVNELKDLHLQVAEIIRKPLNAAFDRYDPHMTLFNSSSAEVCMEFNHNPYLPVPLVDEFTVALGLIDAVGQITKIIYSKEN